MFQVYQLPETSASQQRILVASLKPVKYYKALPNEHMEGAQSIVPTGNVLG